MKSQDDITRELVQRVNLCLIQNSQDALDNANSEAFKDKREFTRTIWMLSNERNSLQTFLRELLRVNQTTLGFMHTINYTLPATASRLTTIEHDQSVRRSKLIMNSEEMFLRQQRMAHFPI